MVYNILLVDDDVNQAAVLERVIQDKALYHIEMVNSGQEAVKMLTSEDNTNVDLVILDLSLPSVSGVEVLKAVKPVRPELPIIVRTGMDDTEMAVEVMRLGASNFIKKLDSIENLREMITSGLRTKAISSEMSLMKRSNGGGTKFDDIIGESTAIKEMMQLGDKVAGSNIPVLLEGESGTGKEFMSRAIHEASHCSGKPFIAVNCGAIPENLVESILFGHEKGAFTGALFKTFGKFREADGGTIFLDEVGELSPDIQVKLLRVLQDGEIDPVGSEHTVKVNVRVISATNRCLSDEVGSGNFREDLYYRLNVFPIYIPSLRSRNGDVDMLIKHFIKSFAKSENKQIDGIKDDAKNMLCNYAWPGNIRQLKNTIFRAVVLCDGNCLGIEDFPQVSQASGEQQDTEFSHSLDANLLKNSDGEFRKMSEIEKDVIISALDHYNGRMSEVARKLGIGRSTLYRKLEDYNIS